MFFEFLQHYKHRGDSSEVSSDMAFMGEEGIRRKRQNIILCRISRVQSCWFTHSMLTSASVHFEVRWWCRLPPELV